MQGESTADKNTMLKERAGNRVPCLKNNTVFQFHGIFLHESVVWEVRLESKARARP